ncbi:MAG: VWA domain-containing protein [Promethearchaeota archaeon]
MSKELKLFVEPVPDLKKVLLSPANADKIGLPNGGSVEIVDGGTGKKTRATLEVSQDCLDFSAKVDADLLNSIEFDSLELTIVPVEEVDETLTAAAQALAAQLPTPEPEPDPMEAMAKLAGIQVQESSAPAPAAPPAPAPAAPPAPAPAAPPAPAPAAPPATLQPGMPQPGMPQPGMPQPGMPQPGMPQPGMPQPGMPQPGMPQPGMPQPGMPQVPVPPQYPNQIPANQLAAEKNGIVMRPKIMGNLGGRVRVNPGTLTQLGLAEGMLIGWEDPLNRSSGAARVTADNNLMGNEIGMDMDTKADTNVISDEIVVYSTEPPIQQVESMGLMVSGVPDLNGFAFLNPRNAASLQMKPGDIIAFEDQLTGAMGAAKLNIREDLSNDTMLVDEEILEASGVGSMDVDVSKNPRTIIPLQSIDLGIAPILGENLWETISMARQNVGSIKAWLMNYIIFKGIKLRWKAANTACSVLNTVPDLTGDVFAQVTPNTTLTLKPMGLVTFNAILIIDISRSMMARDVEVTNIAPAIEGIKAAMESKEIQDFMRNFKDGIMVPRRMSAAFAAILFLSEKVGRGFGEKVSIIRFADQADILSFGGMPYMDSASGKKGILEEAARKIVDNIGNAYGQATNMGLAMLKAQEVLYQFDTDQPTMIVLLTDGVPTDGNDFFTAIQEFSKNPNVVLYIIGLGNPDREAMNKAAALCGGEYFEPEDAGELLVWYSKRARDLQVKMKSNR